MLIWEVKPRTVKMRERRNDGKQYEVIQYRWLLLLHNELKRRKTVVLEDACIWYYFKWNAWKNCVSDLSGEEEEIHLPSSLPCSIYTGHSLPLRELIFSHFYITAHSHLKATPDCQISYFPLQWFILAQKGQEELQILGVILDGLAAEESVRGRPSTPTCPGVTEALWTEEQAELFEAIQLSEQSEITQGIWNTVIIMEKEIYGRNGLTQIWGALKEKP